MDGGLSAAANKIVGAYADPSARTGVFCGRVAAWGISGSAAAAGRLDLGELAALDQAQGCSEQNQSVSRCRLGAVARAASHGGGKGERSQALGLRCRLIAGLTNGEASPRSCGRSGAAGQAGLPPFRPAPGPTTVARDSRGSTTFRAGQGPDQCLNAAVGSKPSGAAQRVGVRAVPSDRPNGVRGAGKLGARESNRARGAAGQCCEAGKHQARVPFRERERGRYGAEALNVN